MSDVVTFAVFQGHPELQTFLGLAVAVGLGLLVGVERQYAAKSLAGIRTFALITLGGAMTTLAASELGGWVVGAGFFALAIMFATAYHHAAARRRTDPGMTTEVAGLLMFAVGAICMLGFLTEAIVSGAVVALLLHWKDPLHRFVEKMGPADIRALIRLVIIGLVILPILPDEAYGPYDAFNPFRMWLLVVLVVAISLGAYVTYRLMGAKVGTLLAGVLGGLISSTAMAFAYARQTRQYPKSLISSTLVIIIASTMVFVRVLVEVGLVASQLMPQIAPPLVAMGLFMAAMAAVLFLWPKQEIEAPVATEPPSILKPALVFGILYAVIKFAVAVVQAQFGSDALYPVAIVSGFAQMDAITLSVGQLAAEGRISPDQAWRLILAAGLSNNVIKAILAASLGTWQLGWRMALLFALSIVAGLLIIFFWPDTPIVSAEMLPGIRSIGAGQ